jgi:hypothetical protein
MDNTMQHWTISIFSVAGAFFLCGICGAGTASLFGMWEEPMAGFFAAFGTVSMAYLSAPCRKKQFALIVFLLGALCAWLLIGNSWYPESYPAKAYQPTYLPFVITLFGGLVPLSVILFPSWISRHQA